jgi:SpoVK/Ycf46/Vps4 family AAA+-type ATPase
MSKSKSKSATPLFDKLVAFSEKKTCPYPNLASALKALKHFVGFNEIKETLSKQIQFFICHHLTQIPTRRSKRKRKTRSDLRSAKRPRFGSTDSEEEEEEDTSEEAKRRKAMGALVRLFSRAIEDSESESDSDSDSDYEEEEDDEEIKRCAERLKLMDGHFIHTMLLGPPGVGKTTFAKILANVWASLGLCDPDKFKVTRRSDWVARYSGQSVNKAKKLIQSCKGGVIFFDEAYSLIAENGDDSYGYEVLTEIVESMSNPDRQVIYIFAGYDKDLQRLFKANKGFERRLGYTFKFNKPTISQLMEIFIAQMKMTKWKMPRAERIKTAEIFQQNKAKFTHAGGTTNQLLFFAKQSAVLNCFPKPLKKALHSDDVLYAFQALEQQQKMLKQKPVLSHMYL